MTITTDHDTLVDTFTHGSITLPVPADHFTGDFEATYEDPDVLDRRNGHTV